MTTSHKFQSLGTRLRPGARVVDLLVFVQRLPVLERLFAELTLEVFDLDLVHVSDVSFEGLRGGEHVVADVTREADTLVGDAYVLFQFSLDQVAFVTAITLKSVRHDALVAGFGLNGVKHVFAGCAFQL